ncbi:MAG: hypothetical protein RLZZ156_2935 [Deinococcota bacterium]|jgi:uncharacterized protein (DUF697 family)
MNELELYQTTVTSVTVANGSLEHEETVRIIKERALWCAGVSLEPVPFLDLAVILPLHVKMVWDIGKAYGFALTRERAKEIALELAGTVALNYATRLATRSAMKAIPFFGAVLNAPLVYASTYALGVVAERYFRARRPELPALENTQTLSQSIIEQGKQMAQGLDWKELLRMLEKSRKKS